MALERTIPHPVSASYTCEAPGCGASVTDVDVVSVAVVVRLPGKNGIIPAFQCGAEQHYGCTLEHAWLAAQACFSEHIQPVHKELHTKVEADADLSAQVQAMRDAHPMRPRWKLDTTSVVDAGA